MNEHIQSSVERAKAEAFAKLLADQNPHILFHIIRPYRKRFSKLAKSDDELSVAMNIIMEFVMQLDPFPTAPEHMVQEVAKRLSYDSDYFYKAEVEIAVNIKDKAIQGWRGQVLASEILTQITIPDNDDMIVAIRNVLWGIFSCLRQALRN